MDADIPFFDVPLNLPHAATVSRRLQALLQHEHGAHRTLQTADQLRQVLSSPEVQDIHPPTEAMLAVRDEAAELGRKLVGDIQREHLGFDRLGQLVRNLFECLALGKEGAILSLRAGESPTSLQRPV